LILDGTADGYTNMAVDEAILESHIAGQVPPTIRFYRWHPACLSIGYFQRAAREVDEEGCRQLGVDWVRRPTGGRAILHDVELTYSITARKDTPLVSGNIRESYRKISQVLVDGLCRLGAPAEMAPARARGHGLGSAACFDAPSDYEVIINGRKVIGSAQVRRAEGLLQHGSILLDVDLDRQVGVLIPPPEMDREELVAYLRPRLTSLQESLGRSVSPIELVDTLRASFEQVWGITLQEGTLSPEEKARLPELRARYASDEWNRRR
jgi:lipoate-protein ligase A